jgi:hypothetical protein
MLLFYYDGIVEKRDRMFEKALLGTKAGTRQAKVPLHS